MTRSGLARRFAVAICQAAVLAAGCAREDPAPSPTLSLSADWLNGSLSVLDRDALLAAGSSYDAALIEQVDISSQGLGPLSLVVGAAGRRAAIIRSPGVISFVGPALGIAAETLPEGGRAVLLFDLETRRIVSELEISAIPLQIVLDATRDRIFVSLFDGSGVDGSTGSIAVYDFVTLDQVAQVPVAPFLEGIAVSDAGTHGAVIAATAGLYLFDPADPGATLSGTPLKLADDSSGVTFVSGTAKLVVANSRNPSNYVVIDASDLEAPVVVDEGEPLDGVPFIVAAVPGRQQVVLPVSRFESLHLLHLDVSETPAVVLHDIEVQQVQAFPHAVSMDSSGRYAFVGAETSRQLLIFDLSNGSVRRVDWLEGLGPTALVVVP